MEDPPCNLCGLLDHLGDKCDFIATKTSPQVAFKEPLTGIHRRVVYRVYVLASDLYRLHYPQFYPGPFVDTLINSKVDLLLVPLIEPDFQNLPILQAFFLSSRLPWFKATCQLHFLANDLWWMQSPNPITARLFSLIIQPFEIGFKNVSQKNSTLTKDYEFFGRQFQRLAG